MAREQEVRVLDDASSVSRALSPLRRLILDRLAEPDSAAGLAARLRLPRQKVNYHLRELEKGGLVELLEERQRRGFQERVFRLSARAFVVDPSLLGGAALEPAELRDRFSSAHLLATAAGLVRDVGVLRERAARAGKRLLTATLETDAAFDHPRDFEAFSEELVREVARLVQKHGSRGEKGSRPFRIVLAAHPTRRRQRRK